MKPVVVIVGRPNVGKSTLFNRLTRSRSALVSDIPGVTRDRQYGDGKVGDRPYLVVDTGGVVGSLTKRRNRAEPAMSDAIIEQTRQALTEADTVIFLVDGRAGLAPSDRDVAASLRELGKPVTIAVNKAEGADPAVISADFHALGLGAPCALSSAHGEGIDDLMEVVLEPLPRVEDEAVPADIPRIAVAGRPNVGKSTLINAFLGEERVVVSDQPGTTRDAIEIPIERANKSYILVDTAGVRRRHRVDEAIERFSAIKTLQAIDAANVVILVIDAVAGVSEQDASLAGYVMERGRALVLAINKWDGLDSSQRAWAAREVERKLGFLSFAPLHRISALKKSGIGALFGSVDKVFASARRPLPTSRITQVLEEAVSRTAPPVVRGRRMHLKFAHQGGKNPPLIVVYGSQAKSMPASYRRYLENAFREAFHLVGTPVRIECRESVNPYADKRPSRRRKDGKWKGK